jgi:YesN/AraC family two-component response regulator
MPRMQGRELAKRVHGIHPEAKVVYMSGYAASNVAQHGVLETGAAYLQKPFTEQQLLRTLEDIFE